MFAGYHVTMDTTFIAVEGFAQLSDASVGISATDGANEGDQGIDGLSIDNKAGLAFRF